MKKISMILAVVTLITSGFLVSCDKKPGSPDRHKCEPQHPKKPPSSPCN